MIRIDALGARIDELAQHRFAVPDDANIDLAWRGGDFVGIDIDARDLGATVETGRRRMADDEPCLLSGGHALGEATSARK